MTMQKANRDTITVASTAEFRRKAKGAVKARGTLGGEAAKSRLTPHARLNDDVVARLVGPFTRVKRGAKVRKGFVRVLLKGQLDPRANGLCEVPEENWPDDMREKP